MARRKFSAQNFCAEKEGKFCTASSTPPYEKWGMDEGVLIGQE
jgi:hypothetical protein